MWTKTRVECYAGYRGDETPRRFRIGGHRVVVRNIDKRWIEPDYRCFQVTGDDHGTYILRQDKASDGWEVSVQ
ncbi:MAG: hypothetical protein U5R49_16235 [Deltaproteobacteria bacterium]|nr:hypothetical protein [Deltaproteobacteria bacterium]